MGRKGIDVSHHFDTPTAREESQAECFFNPAATRDSAAPSRDEAIYTFHFDTDLDGSQNVSFAVGFTTVSHANPGDLEHVQNYAGHRGIHTSGVSAEEVVASGVTGASTPERDDVRAFAGGALNSPDRIRRRESENRCHSYG
jgi:hypothetical protein